MQEQEQAEFYDKLLGHLNKSFLTNFKAQELYLDLTRNKRKLRFKSIKNIYNVLTEGKADEIIYEKDKPIIASSQVHDQSYAKRISWRLIEKLINKIAYYLSYERGLADLAPSILKAIGLARKATDKITCKASFTQFFEEVVDLLVVENNILAKKIYNLLIERGYIYSIEQFYKLSRFEHGSDFIYNFQKQKSDEEMEEPSFKSKMNLRHSKGDKKRLTSTRKMGYRSSAFTHLVSELQEEDASSKLKKMIGDITEKDESSEDESASSAEDFDKVNRINHTIHSQVEKVIDELVHHPNYNLFLESIKEDTETTGGAVKKDPPIKQIIKNLRLKNFRANQQILEINKTNLEDQSTQRKNSNQKLDSKMPSSKNRAKATIRNRTSIANALSNRMKERMFKTQGLGLEMGAMNDLVISNLSKLSHSGAAQAHRNNSQKGLKKAGSRQKSLELNQIAEELLKNKPDKKAANIDFLSHAFVFKKVGNNQHLQNKSATLESDFRPSKDQIDQANPRDLTYSRDLKSSNDQRSPLGKSLETIFSQNYLKGIRRSLEYQKQQNEPRLFFNQKITQLKKTDSSCEQKTHKRTSTQNKFNIAMLEFTAKKYNKFSSEGDEVLENICNTFSSSPLFTRNRESLCAKKESKMIRYTKEPHYQHHRNYEVFDRRTRKIV